MPYIDQNELIRLNDEAEKVIILNESLEKKNKELENALKQRKIFMVAAILVLIGFLGYAFGVPKSKGYTEEYLIENSLELVSVDSIQKKETLLQELRLQLADQQNGEGQNKNGISSQKVIYSVQIGAFDDFNMKWMSEELQPLMSNVDNGYYKYSVGNFITYAEALQLKKDLKKIGFRDTFIKAQSFGEPVNIREALALSEEQNMF